MNRRKSKTVRESLAAAWDDVFVTLPALAKKLRDFPYDGIHGLPTGLSRDVLRRFVRARKVLLLKRKHGGERVSPELALRWIDAHRNGNIGAIPNVCRREIITLADTKEQDERRKREEKARKQIANLPKGPKEAGKKSAEGKDSRLEKVRDAIRKLGESEMILNLPSKRVYEILLNNQGEYFEDGKQPYKSQRGLYDAVRKIRAE